MPQNKHFLSTKSFPTQEEDMNLTSRKVLFYGLMLCLLLLKSTIIHARDEAPKTGDQPTPMEGYWRVDSSSWAGETIGSTGDHWRFTGSKAEWISGNEVVSSGEFTLDMSQSPSHCDFNGIFNGEALVRRGIITIDGPRLKWAFTEDKERPRPSSVSNPNQEPYLVLTMKRVPDVSRRPLAAVLTPEPKLDKRELKPLSLPDHFKFSLLEIGNLNVNTVATDINDQGTVLGEVGDGSSKRPWLWRNGRGTVLSNFDLPNSKVYAINDQGVVAGVHLFENGSKPHFEVGGELFEMQCDLKSPFRLPHGINDYREIVGASFSGGDITSSWHWKDGKIKGIPGLGGWLSEAMAINNSGHIVGSATLREERDFRAFLYRNGQIENLGTLGGRESKAFDISEQSDVVGYSLNQEERHQAFHWTSGEMKPLPYFEGGDTSWAWSVNDTGWIAGWSSDASGTRKAAIWHDGKIYDVAELTSGLDGWHLEIARAVNNSGMIAGTARRGSQLRAFQLIPAGTAAKAEVEVAEDSSSKTTDKEMEGSSTHKRAGAGSDDSRSESSSKTDSLPTGKFVLIDLGTLGGKTSEARSVNEKGQVVGVSENASGLKRAFLWDLGEMQEISADEALDINHDGVVVGLIKQGSSIFGDPKTQAFRWSEIAGIETDLLPRINVGLTPKQLTGHARAINDRGDIAMIGEGIAMYAVARDAGGDCRDLGHLGGMVSIPYDINDRGEVCGYSKIDRRTVHAFLYRGGTMLDLGSLGFESGAHSVNNAGEVVGASKDQLARMRAFHWKEGRMIDLGTLGGQTSNARAINDQSWIVGNAQTRDGKDHAFLYRDEKMHDLNDLIEDADGWVIEDAYRISNRNQIAAVARRDGLKRAVLLSPVELKGQFPIPAMKVSGASPVVKSEKQTKRLAEIKNDAPLKDGEKTLGSASKGTQFEIESVNGNWLLGTFTINGKEVRCWVEAKNVNQNMDE